MGKLNVPQDSGEEPGVVQARLMDDELRRQRVRDSVQSLVSSTILVGLLMVVLALIAIIPWGEEMETVVVYNAPSLEKEELVRTEVSQQARPKPPGMRSSRARVIASNVPGPVAVPIPDNPIPEGPFGMAEEIGYGFGDSEGDGDGGGGVNFFGNYRRGKRVAFLVDYSGSMGSNVEGGGGTRLAALKQELAKSIEGLSPKMNFAVIFFSHHGWTIETEGPNHADNGWNGLGDTPHVNWYPANQAIKARVVSQIRAMPAGGNTNWYMPLKMAFSMQPPPSIVYLLSDGEPRDGDDVLFQMKELNPRSTPVDTIAFELPGSPASMLMEIANVTGGRFTMIYKGERLKGRAAENLTSSTYD